jgi:hypothetical protein
MLKIGAHVSAAKGVQNAVTNAVRIGYFLSLAVLIQGKCFWIVFEESTEMGKSCF